MSKEIWDKLSKPPVSALKEIRAGRLKGMSDINPQWRYKALTGQFGLCGVGWKFEIVKLWTEPGDNDQVFAFAQINLFIKEEEWSSPIPGVGGSMLINMESKGLHCNDEAYKMAITDALSTACKMIGVASAIYEGNWDGSKYKDEEPPAPKSQKIDVDGREQLRQIAEKIDSNNFGEALNLSAKFEFDKAQQEYIGKLIKLKKMCVEINMTVTEATDYVDMYAVSMLGDKKLSQVIEELTARIKGGK